MNLREAAREGRPSKLTLKRHKPGRQSEKEEGVGE